MIKVTLDPKVLAALTLAFPKPENSAANAIEKYRVLLEELLSNAVQLGRSTYEIKLKLYSIPVEALSAKGPHIGSLKNGTRVRLHRWLEQNNLSLIKNVERGTSQNKIWSKVSLTKLMTIEDVISNSLNAIKTSTNTKKIDSLLTGDDQTNSELFDFLYPDYYKLTPAKRAEIYEPVPINIKSLLNYIVWLNTKSRKYKKEQKQEILRQATTILCIAKHTKKQLDALAKKQQPNLSSASLRRNKPVESIFFQRQKPSVFGRTYYKGTSVQNVNKELRSAMLGDCWEYDIRGSVVCWKLGIAIDICAEQAAYRKKFFASIWYLEDKNGFVADIIRSTFDSKSNVKPEQQKEYVKKAITALSFGARAQAKGWRARGGEWVNPALAEIIMDVNERNRFVNCYTVKHFIQEQIEIDAFIYKMVAAENPALLLKPYLRTEKSPSKSKIVAYFYQRSETLIMKNVEKVLLKNGRKIIARIHDAFVVKNKLSVDLQDEIEYAMQLSDGNPFWKLKATELKAYKSNFHDVRVEELAHRNRMKQAQKDAASGVTHRAIM